MKINIVGNGSFGTFLKKEFIAKGHEVNRTAKYDIHILAVPFQSYEKVATYLVKEYGKYIHLVNVCSVQEETNKILAKAVGTQGTVTGIHPLFGERSSKNISDRVSIVTWVHSSKSQKVLNLFSEISMVREDGISGKEHDEMMAKTHLKVVEISQQIQKIVEEAEGIPDYMWTPSFRKMKEMADQFLDMPAGTKDSILANKYK